MVQPINIEFFLCKTDYLYELGETTCDTYDSLERLKKERPCVMQCGAVKVSLKENGTYIIKEVIEENRNWSENE